MATKDQPPITTADVDREMNEIRNSIKADEKNNSAILDMLADLDPSKKDDIEKMRRKLDAEATMGEGRPANPETDEPTLPTPDSPTPPSPKTTVEKDHRTPEEKRVYETRTKYITEYLRCKEITKKKSSIFDVFDGKKKREIKEQEHLDQAYIDAKKEYDKARVEMGNSLFDKKKSELMAEGVYGPELDAKLKEYKATEIIDKTIIEQGNVLALLKAESTPVNVSKFKQALNWYIRQKRPVKVLISTVIFTTAAASGVFGAALGTGSLAGMGFMKFVKGVAFGTASAQAAHGIDIANAGRNKRFREAQDQTKSELRDKFGEGKISQEEYEKSIVALEVEDRKRIRKQALVKLAVGVALGAGMGAAASHLGIGGIPGHTENGVRIKTDGIKIPPVAPTEVPPFKGEIDFKDINSRASIDNTYVKEPWYYKHGIDPNDKTLTPEGSTTPGNTNPVTTTEPKTTDPTIKTEEPKVGDPTKPITTTPDDDIKTPTTPETPEIDNVVAEVGKGHGAIKTIEEFQKKLGEKYPEGSTDVPESVKHILNTKADRLAIEYGMFKPGDDAESAIMKLGSKFESDADGNITFTQEGKTTLLEKGDDADVTNVYGGRMIDGDNSGRPSVASEPQTNDDSRYLGDETQKAPAGVVDEDIADLERDRYLGDETQKAPAGVVDENISILDEDRYLGDETQKPPAGVVTEQTPSGLKPVTEPTEGIITPKVAGGSVETGSTIFPADNKYDVGAGNSTSPNFASNREMGDNGFTTKNPMTNEALAEKEVYEQNLRRTETPRTGNIIENPGPKQISIENDPRHVETVRDVRENFGRANVVIDKPDSDYINKIEHNDWNKTADTMFMDKEIKFSSYEDYEKEDELQRLFGRGTQVKDEGEIRYDPKLDKNVEILPSVKVTLDYFREDTNWSTIKKIPAKYFFDFEGAKFADGTAIPQAELDNMVSKGILRESVDVTPGQATTTSYSFTKSAELERLSKVYEKIIPEKDVELGNAKPIGDENIEKYVARMTKRVSTADDGTMFATKEKFVPNTTPAATTSQGYETMRADRVSRSSNLYSNSNAPIRTIRPLAGASGYQTSSDYNLGNKALGIIRNFFR